jgi:hypothetical protein
MTAQTALIFMAYCGKSIVLASARNFLLRPQGSGQLANMASYSDFIDRVRLAEGLLQKLQPADILDREVWRRVRDADDATIAGGLTIGQPVTFSLVRGGLLYALDDLDGAHRIFQEASGDLGAYWHGMIHRREGDFDNARYWFRRAGELPVFNELHGEAAKSSADMARQSTWDPYLFTGQCEQARFGAEELIVELAKLQRAEFNVLFDYSWRQSGLSK